jgi:predicted methyltransferase
MLPELLASESDHIVIDPPAVESATELPSEMFASDFKSIGEEAAVVVRF